MRKSFGKRLLAVFAAIASGFGMLVATSVSADGHGNYPERPITVICCYGKGGGSDQAVDAIVGPAAKIMNAKINKINITGGGGLNCLPEFLQAPADGYTLLQHIDTLTSRYVEGRIDLNAVSDLEGLVIMNVAPTMLFINADDERFQTDGVPDFDKLVEYAKQEEGKLTVSNINIPMELISMAVVENHFGFKSRQVLTGKSGERFGAVIGGQLDVLMEQPGDVSKYVEGGNLKPILALWPTRFENFPDTKATGQDYGLDWEPLLRFRGMFTKKGTPPEIVDYLAKVFAESYQSEEHQEFVKRKSLDIVDSFRNREDTTMILEESLGIYAEASRDLGLPVREGL